jgi:hypothetical protein
MALGTGPVEARAIALRHKFLALAVRDSRPVDLPPFSAGDLVLLDMKFKSQVEEARRVVKVLLVDGAKSLCQFRDENPRWLANVHIRPMPNGAGVGAARLEEPSNDEDLADAPPDPGADLPNMVPPIAPHRHQPVDLLEGAGEVPPLPVPENLDAKYADPAEAVDNARRPNRDRYVRFTLPDGRKVQPGDEPSSKL